MTDLDRNPPRFLPTIRDLKTILLLVTNHSQIRMKTMDIGTFVENGGIDDFKEDTVLGICTEGEVWLRRDHHWIQVTSQWKGNS